MALIFEGRAIGEDGVITLFSLVDSISGCSSLIHDGSCFVRAREGNADVIWWPRLDVPWFVRLHPLSVDVQVLQGDLRL